MQLDLRKIFTEEEKALTFDFSVDWSGLEVGSYYPFVSPVKVSGIVKGFAGEASLEMEANFAFEIPCDRCAELTKKEYSYSFHHMLVRSLNEEDNDNYIQVENEKLDLDELLREDVLLELPRKFLCKSDCKGLCDCCGINLNKESCNCHKHQIDPRLEVLKQLID